MPAPNLRILEGYGGDAVVITAQATLQPGDSIDLPVDALRNGLGERVLVDSFRWTADAQESVAASADPPTSVVGFPGLSITGSMRFGDKPLTSGEVPLYCLGVATGQDVEHSILAVANAVDTELRLGAVSSGVWVFDDPMEMGQGDALTVHLTHRGLLNLPVVVTVALSGRSGPDLPRSEWLPYAAVWIPPTFYPSVPTATVPVVVTSTERDLINRTGERVQISRFIGRLARLGVSGAPLGGSNVVQNAERVYPSVEEAVSGQPQTEWYSGAVDSFMTILLRDSRANENVPVAVPFRMAFEPEKRSWECPHEMDVNGYYIGQLALAVPAVIDAAIQPSISMIGSWRGR